MSLIVRSASQQEPTASEPSSVIQSPEFQLFGMLPPELRLEVWKQSVRDSIADHTQSGKQVLQMQYVNREAREALRGLVPSTTHLSIAEFHERISRGIRILTEDLYIHTHSRLPVISLAEDMAPSNFHRCNRLIISGESFKSAYDDAWARGLFALHWQTDAPSSNRHKLAHAQQLLRYLSEVNFNTLSYPCDGTKALISILALNNSWDTTIGGNRSYPRLEIRVPEKYEMAILGDPEHVDMLDSHHSLLSALAGREYDLAMTILTDGPGKAVRYGIVGKRRIPASNPELLVLHRGGFANLV